MCVNLFMRLLFEMSRKSFHANTCHPTIKYYYNRSKTKKEDFRRNKLHESEREMREISNLISFLFTPHHQHLASHINSFVMLRVIELAASD
jgi:hypothetical protein